MTNAIEYLRQEATDLRYFEFNHNNHMVVKKGNPVFSEGKIFTEQKYDEIRDGYITPAIIKVKAKKLVAALEEDAREWFAEWEIPMEKYDCEISFGYVTCRIDFIHKESGAVLVLEEVYFDDETGKILQAEMSFG